MMRTEPYRGWDRRLRESLDEAHGESEFVIVVAADIRGFSAFSQRRESPELAMYLRRVYIRLMDDYFPDAAFYKATGDGLMIAMPYDDDWDLYKKLPTMVENCVRCLADFPTICKGDPMVNFATPDKIGFGIARGAACRISTGAVSFRLRTPGIIDYSGYLLNLAARLVDLARPSGVVVDGGVGLDLLAPRTRKLFERHDVYIRGIAEDQPRTVYALKGAVKIPEEAKRPFGSERWETIQVSKTVREWKAVDRPWRVPLPRPLKRPDGLVVNLESLVVRRGKVVKDLYDVMPFTAFRHEVLANTHHVVLSTDEIMEYARGRKLRQDSAVTAYISYVPG